jgi:hypothetical protein
MERTEHWLYVLLILGWITFVSLGITLHSLIHALPLIAVLILANRLQRRLPASAPLAERVQSKAMAAD